MKKALQISQQNEERMRRGEMSRAEFEEKQKKAVIPIPNPENQKKKVPIRLHEKIKETTEPVVGLDYVTEVIAASDPEMEPHYECELCGSKGIANGMYTHIMGGKHRQQFVLEYYRNDPRHVIDLSQKDLLDYARKHSENQEVHKIRSKVSDDEYPWPAGKAPWSVERGGSGRAPDKACENFGRNKEGVRDIKPVILGGFGKSERKPAVVSGIPAPSALKAPKNGEEAIKMVQVAQRLMELGTDFIGPQLSYSERSMLKLVADSVVSKIVTKRNVPPPATQASNGNLPSPSSSKSSKRQYNSRSRSPSPPNHRMKRER